VHRTPSQKEVLLFSHLEQYEREYSVTKNVKGKSRVGSGAGGSKVELHHEIVKLGLQFAELKIVGANARCKAMLLAFKKVVSHLVKIF
jgi:hypothetical protein